MRSDPRHTAGPPLFFLFCRVPGDDMRDSHEGAGDRKMQDCGSQRLCGRLCGRWRASTTLGDDERQKWQRCCSIRSAPCGAVGAVYCIACPPPDKVGTPGRSKCRGDEIGASGMDLEAGKFSPRRGRRASAGACFGRYRCTAGAQPQNFHARTRVFAGVTNP